MNIDQRDRTTSTGEPALAVLSRTRLPSASRGRRLPKNTPPANNAGSRPRLTVLPGGAQSDVELIRSFRADDWGGFVTLCDQYVTTAYLICRHTLMCSETALDATNDTFLAMLANSAHLDPTVWVNAVPSRASGQLIGLDCTLFRVTITTIVGAGERP